MFSVQLTYIPHVVIHSYCLGECVEEVRVVGATYQVGADSYFSMGGVCHTVCTGSTTAKTASNWGQKVVSAPALPCAK